MTWAWYWMVVLSKSTLDLFNAYPFLSSDSYDWLYNGLYYYKKYFENASGAVNPVPRDPLFVSLISLAYALHWEPLVIVFLFLFNALGLYCLFKLLRSWKQNEFVIFLVLSFYIVSPIFLKIRPRILADNIVLGLMSAQLFFIFSIIQRESENVQTKLRLALGFVSGLAVLGQKYGILPLIAFTLVDNRHFLKSFQVTWKEVYRLLLFWIFPIVFLISWYAFKYYEYGDISTGPRQISVLKWNFPNLFRHLFLAFCISFPFCFMALVIKLYFKVPWNFKQAFFKAPYFSFRIFNLLNLSIFVLLLSSFKYWDTRFGTYYALSIILLLVSLFGHLYKKVLELNIKLKFLLIILFLVTTHVALPGNLVKAPFQIWYPMVKKIKKDRLRIEKCRARRPEKIDCVTLPKLTKIYQNLIWTHYVCLKHSHGCEKIKDLPKEY